MVEQELCKYEDVAVSPLPITALCIVSDKSKCPKGFLAYLQHVFINLIITRTHDDGSDADLWRESSFSIWSRPVRYLAVSREIPETAIKATVSVVTDITVVRDSDPIPHGFIAIDYCADSREKSLRKRFICVKTEPRDTVVDAVGEIIILNKSKKTPRGFTLAGEVDGATICFRVVVIPQTFGLIHSLSDRNLASSGLTPPCPGLYPVLGQSGSSPADLAVQNNFTIKNVAVQRVKGDEGVPFKLSAHLAKGLEINKASAMPELSSFDIRRLDTDEFVYNFALEKATLANFS
uniref:ESCRT-I complex subunit MVB12A n=1 Tax=Heterorhabditis bacteriophora TaxID=37862 RepID=A0A1I7X5J9_HETBA